MLDVFVSRPKAIATPECERVKGSGLEFQFASANIKIECGVEDSARERVLLFTSRCCAGLAALPRQPAEPQSNYSLTYEVQRKYYGMNHRLVI
jgi:hypothetical protein